MTKQQLLALLREAFNRGEYECSESTWGDGGINADEFIEEAEHTNRVGDLELPDINKLKADAVREAANFLERPDVPLAPSLILSDDLHEYADKLERGEL